MTDEERGDTRQPGYTPPDITLVGDEHVKAYLETDGEVGHEWNGASCLLLSVTGRKTGKERTSALIYGVDGESYLVVASKGGAPTHPEWYVNLTQNPDVTVQVKSRRFPARARTATPDERARLWAIMVDDWPNYDVYTTRTDREIPVVVLDPV